MKRSWSLLFLALIFVSCSTIIKGSKATSLAFEPNAVPDRIVLKNQRTNTESQIHVTDSIFISLRGKHKYFKRSKYEITFFKSGFTPATVHLTPKITFWYWLNIPLGGIWMLTVDPATGAMYQYKQTKYSIIF